MTQNKIPVYQPALNGNEKKYVNECLDTTWISSRGSFVSRFENEFKKYLKVRAATSVSNGTVAIHLALHAMGIGPGDEVIVPSFTYIASVNAIAYTGATPVFIDSEPDSWNLDTSEIASKISPNTRAIMAVHLYGNPCDMAPIVEICRQHKLYLIEDVAEAFGSTCDGQFVGNFGDISTFSFFGNKTITTGEGGMVAGNSKELIDRCAYLKNQAVSPSREYWHDDIGFNYRMTNICAAIGVAQLEKADEIIRCKRRIADWYKAELKDCPVTFQKTRQGDINTYWMVSILAEDENKRDGIREHLKANGIETRPLFNPVHKMPVFKSDDVFPVAEMLRRDGLNLPSFPALAREQVVKISDLIKEITDV